MLYLLDANLLKKRRFEISGISVVWPQGRCKKIGFATVASRQIIFYLSKHPISFGLKTFYQSDAK